MAHQYAASYHLAPQSIPPPLQHEDREENTTRKEGQIQHHYEQPQRYNYHLNSGEDLRTHSEEQDRAPASVSPPIRIHRGPLPPNGSPLSHGTHIRSQNEQVLPGSGHTWFRESLRCGFSSHPLPGPIQEGYCPRHMACSEGNVRRPHRNSMLEKHIQQKIHNRTGGGTRKDTVPTTVQGLRRQPPAKIERLWTRRIHWHHIRWISHMCRRCPTCVLQSPRYARHAQHQSVILWRTVVLHTPHKNEVSSCTGQDPNLMLDENKLPYMNAVTHLGLPRSLRNGSQTVQTRIDCARCSAYSLIPAGLHGENGLPPTASKKFITTYILPRLLYGLEAVTLLKKDLQALDLFYKDLLRNIQSLREGVTTAAIYLLIGLTPAEGELHIQILTLYGAKSRLPTNSPIKRLAEQQLTFGQKGSWFIYMKDIALMYGMTEIILASLYASWDRIKWKHFITSTISNYWFDKLEASYRAKMLTGSYILQSKRARFNQDEVDPTCPQCSATTDDIPQILMECPALKPAHDKHLPTLSNLCKSLDITVPKCKNEWCALILNCGDRQSCPHSGGQPKQWITIPCKCKKTH